MVGKKNLSLTKGLNTTMLLYFYCGHIKRRNGKKRLATRAWNNSFEETIISRRKIWTYWETKTITIVKF